MRSTVSNRLAAQLRREKSRREAALHRKRKASSRRAWRKAHASIQIWLKIARQKTNEPATIRTQDERGMIQDSGVIFGYVSHLNPYLWRYHLDPYIARITSAEQLG